MLSFRPVFRDDLLTVGEAFEDLIFVDLPRLPAPGEEVKTNRFYRTVGGGALITAVAASRLGLRCRICSALSPSAQSLLRREGVKIRNLRAREEPWAVSAALSTRTDRTFVTFNGINDSLEQRILQPAEKASARHVHLALYPRNCGRWIAVLEKLQKRGVSTSWDFGWNEGLLGDPDFFAMVSRLDFLFLNEQEAVFYAGQADLSSAGRFWAGVCKKVVIKRGAEGSRWISGDEHLDVPAVPVQVVDTTGAGDAFNGGFLAAFLGGREPRCCLELGCRVGSLSTTKAGGIEALPRLEEIG